MGLTLAGILFVHRNWQLFRQTQSKIVKTLALWEHQYSPINHGLPPCFPGPHAYPDSLVYQPYNHLHFHLLQWCSVRIAPPHFQFFYSLFLSLRMVIRLLPDSRSSQFYIIHSVEGRSYTLKSFLERPW